MLEITTVLYVLLCGVVTVRVFLAAADIVSDIRYRKIRTEYIRSITVDEWLGIDIDILCSNSGENGCITVGHRSTKYDACIDVCYLWDFDQKFYYLRIRSPTRMVRHESTRDFFITYEIKEIPNLTDALRMLKL